MLGEMLVAVDPFEAKSRRAAHLIVALRAQLKRLIINVSEVFNGCFLELVKGQTQQTQSPD